MSEFYTKVAGVTAKNTDGTDRQKFIRAYAKPKTALILRREPENKFDPNAVAVFINARAFLLFTSIIQIGYLNKDVAEDISKLLDKGGSVVGYISEVTGGGGNKSLGVNIHLKKVNP